jgi:hypothetical protein
MKELLINQHLFQSMNILPHKQKEECYQLALSKWGIFKVQNDRIHKITEHYEKSKVFQGESIFVHENYISKTYQQVTWLPPDYIILDVKKTVYKINKDNPIQLCHYNYGKEREKWIFETNENTCISHLSTYLQLI